MKQALPVLAPAAPTVPTVPFVALSALWIQLTGSWCNLECVHCLNASGPHAPWLKPLDPATVRRALAEAEALGVREVYFTGGEPFLHSQILPLLEASLAVAPTTVLTNGTLITETVADALATLAARAPYSLEIRVSLDDVDEAINDRVRGAGAWAAALAAIDRLVARGLLPIVTATEITGPDAPGRRYRRFRDFLLARGVARPRLKILPVLPIGRAAGPGDERLTPEALEGFDRRRLPCAESRVLAADGVYACPILAGLPGARLSDGVLAEALGPARLYHTACVTCHRTGITCANG